MLKLKNCTLNTFIERISDKTVLAYGAGKILRTACDTLGAEMVDRIDCIVDVKGGADCFFEYGNFRVPVKTLESLNEINTNTSILLITPLVYYEIYEYLDNCAALDGIDCYIYPIMREIAEPHLFPNVSPNALMRIPQKIHCIWFGRSEMTDLNKRCMESWTKFNPTYEIVMWNEDNYDLNRFPYAYDAYDAKRWALLVDFARFDILYEHGGIYVDTDVEMTASWDFLLYNDFFGFIQNNWFGMGNGFGSVAGNPILKQLMTPLLQNDYTKIDVSKYSEKVIVDNHNLEKCKSYGIDIWHEGEWINGGAKLFPQDMVILNTRFAYKTANTIGIHYYERTWSSELKAKEVKYTKFINKHRLELEIK